MKLIIAEKQIMANKIATALGVEPQGKAYYTGGDTIISWCRGHLVALADPDAYSPEWKKWRLETLPILPDPFTYIVPPEAKNQFQILKTLMEREDVDQLVAATDAGREGELIFRLVYAQTGCSKPFTRLWANSLEPEAIRAAMEHLQPSSDFDNLFAAAKCRQLADWILGINLTRFYTVGYAARDKSLSCGRVQTPTLAFLVERQKEIDGFVPSDYYVVTANLEKCQASVRTDTAQEAADIVDKCAAAKVATVTTVETQNHSKAAPPLTSSTAMQRLANQLLGYSAQETADYLQSLYEKGLSTYPRTSSAYLTADMAAPTADLIRYLLSSEILPTEFVSLYSEADIQVAQIIDDSKVEDHPAITPTSSITPELLVELPTGERNILLLLIYRLLAAVYRPHQYVSTKVTIRIADVDFETTGKVIRDAGWREISDFGNSAVGQAHKPTAEPLPEINQGDELPVVWVNYESKKTKPPEPYSDGTLLTAMETAGKHMENDEYRAAMGERGLGTDATRPSIIEGLIRMGYATRDKRHIVPTQRGQDFISIVDEVIKSPELTGQWETELAKIERGQGDPSTFMRSITQFLQTFIPEATAKLAPNAGGSLRESLGICPICGKAVIEYPKSYSCESGKSGCGFVIWKELGGKSIPVLQVKKLLKDGESDLLRGFVSKKTGRAFNAYLVLKEDKSVGFRFPEPSHTKIPKQRPRRSRRK